MCLPVTGAALAVDELVPEDEALDETFDELEIFELETVVVMLDALDPLIMAGRVSMWLA